MPTREINDDTATDRASRAMPKLHRAVDGLALSTADAQLWLLLAFFISFRLQSMCSLSIYHLQVVIHVGAIGLATSALTLLIVPDFGGSKYATIVRILVLITCITGYLITATTSHDARIGQVQYKPPAPDQNASLVLLPAYCLIEKGFDPTPDLTAVELESLANGGRHAALTAQIIMATFCIGSASLIACFTITYFTKLRRHADAERKRDEPSLGSSRGRFMLELPCVKAVLWLVCLLVITWNAVNIWLLRDWVHKSGWMALKGGRNPEDEIQGVGQLAPLVALGAVGNVVLERFALPGGPPA